MDQDSQSSRENFDALGRRFVDAMRANQSATDMFDEAVAQFLGVNRSDGRCLDIIDRFGRVTAGQLASESGLTTGAVTAVIDRLERGGYARRVRDTSDRRKVWIEITEDMRTIIDRLFGHFARLSPTIMSRFSHDQLMGILEYLEIGATLNRDMALVLRDHLDPAAKTVADRVVNARAFERAAEAASPKIHAAVAAIRGDVG